MEEVIKNLEDWTDPATKQMLQNLVERKRKYDRLKSQHQLILFVAVSFSCFYFYYVYRLIYLPHFHSVTALFSAFFDDRFNPFFLFALLAVYGLTGIWKRKADEAEEEFEALRREIIDKSKDLWDDGGSWKKRHIVFEIMKNHFDINLYHENK